MDVAKSHRADHAEMARLGALTKLSSCLGKTDFLFFQANPQFPGEAGIVHPQQRIDHLISRVGLLQERILHSRPEALFRKAPQRLWTPEMQLQIL